MKRFYNIQAGYDLAKRAVDAVYGVLPGFDYFEDFVDHQDPCIAERVGTPQKHTVLHLFLENLEVISLEPSLYDISHSENFEFLESYMRVAGVELPGWFNESQIDDHSKEVKALFPEVAKIAAESAFEILFNDREFLYEFQLRLRGVIRRDDTPRPSKYYDERGRVKRADLPKWLERAVCYRDRGRCQECFKDVSGKVFHLEVYHLDHVLSLAEGGTNDPTNFQMLCEKCNLQKGKRSRRPTNRQVRFWEMK